MALPSTSLGLLRHQPALPAPRPAARHLHRGRRGASTLAQARRDTDAEPAAADRLAASSTASTTSTAAAFATSVASTAAAAVLVAALSMGVTPTVASALPPMNCNR